MSEILQKYCQRVNRNLGGGGFLLVLLLWPGLLQAVAWEYQGQSVSNVESIQQLARQPAWLNLLHYENSLLGGMRSLAGPSDFFLSEKGHEDPAAELAATLKAFLQPTQQVSPNRSPQCRFPARWKWLREQLPALQLIESISCPAFEAWRQQYEAQHISLLFPGMYLQNPASMFGHLFLRFDPAANNALLNQTLNYAAKHDETDSAISYAWKGLTGGYAGHFSVQPFYETLVEYSDLEQRDIWEYRLDLRPQEIDQLVRHLWEIRDVAFDYYFLTDNCAYQLLSLLDVARPGLKLREGDFELFAAPVDVVRQIHESGMVAAQFYRPSSTSKRKFMHQQLDSHEQRKLQQVLADPDMMQDALQGMDVRKQARILEVIHEQAVQSSDDALATKSLSLLSQIVVKDELFNSQPDYPPEKSHASSRMVTGGGQLGEQSYISLGWRPVLHDALDDGRGMIRGSRIEVLDMQLNMYPDENTVRLEKLTLFAIRSLAIDDFQPGVSAQFDLKITPYSLAQDHWLRTFNTRFGVGYAIQSDDIVAFGFINGRIDYHPELLDKHAAYVGAEVGINFQTNWNGRGLQFELGLQHYQQVSGQMGDFNHYLLGVQFNSSVNHGWRLKWEREDKMVFDFSELGVSYLYYF